MTENEKFDALSDARSGDYLDEATAQFRCVAYVGGEPYQIGVYSASLPEDVRLDVSGRIWRDFLELDKNTGADCSL